MKIHSDFLVTINKIPRAKERNNSGKFNSANYFCHRNKTLGH